LKAGETMQDWAKAALASVTAAVVAAFTGALKYLYSRQKAQTARQEAVEEGVQGLLHSELYKECGVCEKKGFATADDLKNLEYLYKPYHALGGNGTGTVLYERVKKLPGSPAEKEQTA
jgi:hypothetical protein